MQLKSYSYHHRCKMIWLSCSLTLSKDSHLKDSVIHCGCVDVFQLWGHTKPFHFYSSTATRCPSTHGNMHCACRAHVLLPLAFSLWFTGGKKWLPGKWFSYSSFSIHVENASSYSTFHNKHSMLNKAKPGASRSKTWRVFQTETEYDQIPKISHTKKINNPDSWICMYVYKYAN